MLANPYLQTRGMTTEAFEAFTELPENAERLFELIMGAVVEKVPTNAFSSAIATTIAFFLKLFLRDSGIEGHMTGADGGYMVMGERYAPDVAYISKARQPKLTRRGYNPNPPELAVEVESPTTAESERRLRAKLFNYLAAGTMVWVIYPDTLEIEVYAPGQSMRILGMDDTLDGADVLPGFKLAVKEVFTEE